MQQAPSIVQTKKTDEKSQQKQERLSFERFLQLKELKSHRKLLEKKLKAQTKRDRQEFMMNRVRIMPPKLQKGFVGYNPEKREEITSRKISYQGHSQNRHSESFGLPKVKNQGKMEWVHRWNLMQRKDEINSIHPAHRTLTNEKNEPNKTENKFQKSERIRISTDPSGGSYVRRVKKSINL